MKDYREVAQEILQRRDIYEAKRKKRIKRVTAALSCVCLAALLGVGVWYSGFWGSNSIQNPSLAEQGDGEHAGAVNYGEDTGDVHDLLHREEPSDVIQLPSLYFNSVTISDVGTADVALLYGDLTELSYEKLLDHYGVSLSIEEQFLDLSRRQDRYEIYRDPQRGVYYDQNCVTYVDANGTVKLKIAFSKTAHRPNTALVPTDTGLEFTEVNGRQLALFCYTDDAGALCYCVELLQDGVGWYVTTVGMSEEEFLRVLLSVVVPSDSEDTEHVLSGTVSSVDTYAGVIGIRTQGQASGCMIWLPDTISAEEFALGDPITVTYTGEPATIQTIWSQQVIDVK